MDLENWLVPIFAIAFSFGIPGAVFIRFLDVRNKERMALIDKGANVEELKDLFRTPQNSTRNNLNNLRFGLLAVFIGGGLFAAIQLHSLYNWPEEFIPAFILLSGGTALLIFYIIVAKLERKQSL